MDWYFCEVRTVDPWKSISELNSFKEIKRWVIINPRELLHWFFKLAEKCHKTFIQPNKENDQLIASFFNYLLFFFCLSNVRIKKHSFNLWHLISFSTDIQKLFFLLSFLIAAKYWLLTAENNVPVLLVNESIGWTILKMHSSALYM